jgi:hypothetical protein
VLGVGGVWCVSFGLGSIRLTVFLSRVMRFSCLVSDFVMGGRILGPAMVN